MKRRKSVWTAVLGMVIGASLLSTSGARGQGFGGIGGIYGGDGFRLPQPVPGELSKIKIPTGFCLTPEVWRLGGGNTERPQKSLISRIKDWFLPPRGGSQERSDESKLFMNQDNDGKTIQVANLTKEAPKRFVTTSIQGEPELSVNKDDNGRTTKITNLTEEEIKLENELTMGPRASLDLSNAGRIISGYVIKDGIKYTVDGGLENLAEQEVQLDVGKEHVILGPNTVLDGEGNLFRGYIIVGDHK